MPTTNNHVNDEMAERNNDESPHYIEIDEINVLNTLLGTTF